MPRGNNRPSLDEIFGAGRSIASEPSPKPSLDEIFGTRAEEPQDSPSMVESAVRGGLQGLTLGFADELGAGAWAAIDALRGKGELGELYETYRDDNRERDREAAEANPTTALVSEVVGGLPTALIPGLNVAKGASAASRIGKAALVGGGYGAGKSEAEDLGGLAKDVALGAGVGGATGGAFELGRKGLEALPKLRNYATLKGAGYMLKDVRRLAHQGRLESTADDIHRLGLMKFGDSAANIAERAGKVREEAGERIGASLREMDELVGPEGMGGKPLARMAGVEADDFSMISPQRATPVRPEVEEAMRRDLEALGFTPQKAVGHYGAPEPSFMVPHAGRGQSDEKLVEMLGKKYGQETVLHSHDLSNRLVPASPYRGGSPSQGKGIRLAPEAQDFYSQLGEKPKFQLGVGFGETPISPDPNRVANRLHELADELSSRAGSMDEARVVRREALKWQKMATQRGNKPLSFSEANVEKGLYDTKVDWGRLQPLRPEYIKKVRHIINEEMEQGADDLASQVGGDLAENWKAAKRDYGVAKNVEQVAGDQGLRWQTKMPLGLPEIGVGVAAAGSGNLPRAIGVASATRVLRERGGSAVAVTLDRLNRLIQANEPSLQKFMPVLRNAAVRGNTSLAAAHFTLHQSNPDYRKALKDLENVP